MMHQLDDCFKYIFSKFKHVLCVRVHNYSPFKRNQGRLISMHYISQIFHAKIYKSRKCLFLAMSLYKTRYPYLKISYQAIKTEKGYLFKVNGKIDDHTDVSCTPSGSPKRHAEK